MIKKYLLCALLFCLVVLSGMAQGWEATVGGENVEIGYSVIPTSDGGVIVCGVTTSFGNDLDEIYVIRLDADGTEIWSGTYGTEDHREYGISMIETSNGDFVIAGYQLGTEMDAKEDIYLVKISSTGTELWSHVYEEEEIDLAYQILETQDGGYAIIGGTESFGSGDRDIYLLKTDENGLKEWDITFGGSGRDQGYSLLQNGDGTYLLAGYIENTNNGVKYSTVISVDASDPLQIESEEFTIGAAITVSGATIINGDEAGYMLATYLDNSVYLVSLDENLQIQWTRELNDINIVFGQSLVATLDGGYVVAGGYEVDTQDDNARLMKVDDNGGPIWTKDYGGLGERDYALGIARMSDNGLVAVGYTRSFGNGYFDVYVIRTDAEGNVNNNFIVGNVYYDLNEDCEATSDEYGLHRWLLQITGDQTYYGLTDELGNYQIAVADGNYTLQLIPLNDYWQSCGNDYSLFIDGPYDTTRVDFPVQSLYDCPLLEVDLSAPFLRRCYENRYTVSYCNDGTLIAEDAQVEVTLDDYLIVASHSIDPVSENGNVFLYDVGDLDVGDCGEFYIDVVVDCDSTLLGQTHCSEAHIYPDSICLPLEDEWFGGSIELAASCTGDSIKFVIKNVGDGPLTAPLDYVIIEDHVILRTVNTGILQPGDTTIVDVLANGSMFRLQGPQEVGHPGNSEPSISVEGCGLVDNSELSLGYLTQYAEDDANAYISIDCQENVGSWDPNDKRGFPKGYEEEHYIEENTDLEYIIRFQNTGTDTAFRVVIRDTISPWLDIRTFRAGAASHNYELAIYDSGIVKFIFEDINLPDSTTNEVASHGFVKFRIGQQRDNPMGTVIYNSAAIYFDFNEPVITNETWHTVGLELPVGYSPWGLELGAEVKVYPNPWVEQTLFEIKTDTPLRQTTLELYDTHGRLLRELDFEENRLELARGNLPNGLYFYQIKSKQRLIFGGKLIAH